MPWPKRNAPSRREAKQITYTPRARTPAPSIALSARALAPVRSYPKAEPCRPGKRAPTAEERAWMDTISAMGCIACRLDGQGFRPAAVHHILRGGRRIGHLFTLPLCDPGHHQGGQPLGMLSRHPWKAHFEARYGTEMELLELLRAEVQAQQVKLGLPLGSPQNVGR